MFTNINYEKTIKPLKFTDPNYTKYLKLRKIQKSKTKKINGIIRFKYSNKFRSLKK